MMVYSYTEFQKKLSTLLEKALQEVRRQRLVFYSGY